MSTAANRRFKWVIALFPLLLIKNINGAETATNSALIQKLQPFNENSPAAIINAHNNGAANQDLPYIKGKKSFLPTGYSAPYNSITLQDIPKKKPPHENAIPAVNVPTTNINSDAQTPPHSIHTLHSLHYFDPNDALKTKAETIGILNSKHKDSNGVRRMAINSITNDPTEPDKGLSSSKNPDDEICQSGIYGNKVEDRSCHDRCNSTSKVCDCRQLKLSSVPKNLPPDTEILNLRDNFISSQGLCNLYKYPKLKRLDLEKNKIEYLNARFFQGLSNLKYLNLRNNSLPMTDENFPEGTFKPLESLKTLIIHRCNNKPSNQSLNYPDKALSHLPNLQTLKMDGLTNKTFGGGFKKLTKLVNLTLAGYHAGHCEMMSLWNHTFENVTQLKVLNISNCDINGSYVEFGAFKPLQNLTILDIHYNEELGLETLSFLMWGLRNSSLKYLDMGSIISRFSSAVHIKRNFTQYFPSTLETIIATGNSIETVDGGIFESECLQNVARLEVGDNRLIFQDYVKQFHKMEKLETLLVNAGSYIYGLPRRFPRRKRSTAVTNDTFLQLPPKLKRVEMKVNNIRNISSFLEIEKNNNLQILNLYGNYLPILKGPFIGFNNLTNLTISSSFVQQISPHFFQNFSSLRSLILSTNLLGPFFEEKNQSVFTGLKNLQVLDLTFAAISQLGVDIFKGLDNLMHLLLAKNIFSNFSVNISHMKKLQLLNLSQTQIHTLPKQIRDHIDQFNVSQVDLSQCPLRCTCENLEFLQWMVLSRAFNRSFVNYDCVYIDDSRITMENGYNETIAFLNKACSSNESVFILVAVATLLIFVLMAVAIFYRFRWRLKYLYYAAYLWYNKRRSSDNSDAFLFDVFISYASPDETFVLEKLEPELKGRGLKVYLHGRDFVTGEYIASNIFAAVRDCKKTLVVLTQNLLSSHWCNYELQMANMEAVYSGRQVLVFLIKENMSLSTLGRQLLYHIRSNTYIEYPTDNEEAEQPGAFDRFWDKLARDLK